MLTQKKIDKLVLFFEDNFDNFLKIRYDNNFNFTLETLASSQEQAVFQILATRQQLELANYDKTYSCTIKAAIPVDRFQEFTEHFDLFQNRLNNQIIDVDGTEIFIEMGSAGRSGDPQVCKGNDKVSRAYVTYSLSINLHTITSTFLSNEIKVIVEGHELLGKVEVNGPARASQYAPEMTQYQWQPDLALMSVGKTLILTFQPLKDCEGAKILFSKNTEKQVESVNIRVSVADLFDYDYKYHVIQFVPQAVAGGRISVRVELHKI